MRPARTGRAAAVESWLLCGWLVVLPLFEAPKHLLWLAWVVAWLVAHGVRAAIRPPRGALEWALVALAASAILAGAGTPQWGRSLNASGDLARLALTAWLVARAGYSARQLAGALMAAVAGALAALLWAMAVLVGGKGTAYLELHSVGHVNHSAIYLAIALAAAVGLAVTALGSTSRASAAVRRGAAPAMLALACGLWISASRAAIGATLAYFALLAARPPVAMSSPVRRRLWLGLVAGLAVTALAVGLIRIASPVPLQPPGEDFTEKFTSRPADSGMLAYRLQLWRVAVLAFGAEPLAGVGNRQFRELTQASLCARSPSLPAAWLPDPCDAKALYFAPHAHSLYANALAERGLAGVLSVVALVMAWGAMLLRALRRDADAAFAGIACASLGAWCSVALTGLLNTTLQHEHGMLAMVLLGGLAGVISGCRAVPDGPSATPESR